MAAPKTAPGPAPVAEFVELDDGLDEDIPNDAYCIVASALGVMEMLSESITLHAVGAPACNSYWAALYLLRRGAKVMRDQATGNLPPDR